MSLYAFNTLKPLKEKGENEYEPEEEQVLEYAEYLGIKLPDEGYMIELAREGVKAQLPQHWQACQAQDGELVYRNLITKVVQEEHPLDEIYRNRVIELREAYAELIQQEDEDLPTIAEEKSDTSLNNDSNMESFAMPSKEFFNFSQPLKQDPASLLNKAVLFQNSKEMSLSDRQNSHILTNISGAYGNKKQSSGETQKKLKAQDSKSKQEKRMLKQKLKQQLSTLNKQEILARELLAQLERSNKEKQTKIRSKVYNSKQEMIKQI